MHTARELDSGGNLKLSDERLRKSQIDGRKHTVSSHSFTLPKPGDTITSKSLQPKHSAHDMYLVRAVSPERVTAQKVLHSLVPGNTKFMSKSYNTHPKHTQILNSPLSLPPPRSVLSTRLHLHLDHRVPLPPHLLRGGTLLAVTWTPANMKMPNGAFLATPRRAL